MGGRILVGALAVSAGVFYWQHGWAGGWILIGTLLQPAVLLGMVPLAFLLGAVRVGLLRVLRAVLSQPPRSPSADRRPPS